MLISISGAHLKNSADLLDRIQRVNYRSKKLLSFDVTPLITNVPVEEVQAVVKEVTKDRADQLPLSPLIF